MGRGLMAAEKRVSLGLLLRRSGVWDRRSEPLPESAAAAPRSPQGRC